MLDAIRSLGGVRNACERGDSNSLDELLRRAALARDAGRALPDVFEAFFDDDEAVLEAAVAPYLSTSLRDIDLAAVCGDALAAAGVSLADFPTYVAAPDGTKVRLTYASNGPYLEAKLQQFFGQSETPVVGPRRVPVALKLLSPAGKVLAETRDLPHFWKAAYPMVRSEMRGKYPKHPWPEDPANAAPTRLTNRAIANSLPMGDAKTRTSRAPAKQKPGGKRRKRR